MRMFEVIAYNENDDALTRDTVEAFDTGKAAEIAAEKFLGDNDSVGIYEDGVLKRSVMRKDMSFWCKTAHHRFLMQFSAR